jgi:CO/xanthine dehydrogenase FAD-binding subunit
MRNHASAVTATRGHCHPERVEHQLALEVVAHRPADDAAAEDVLNGSEEEEALAGLDVLQVADPEPVRLRTGEVTVDEIGRRGSLGITDGRA